MQNIPWLVYVINLDRSKDRLIKIQTQLEQSAIPFIRVSGVDGAFCTSDELALLDRNAYERLHGKSPLLGELGCYLSHVKTMREFLNSQYQFAVILEDDANINQGFKDIIYDIIKIQEHWDMVKLSGAHRGTPLKLLEISDEYTLTVLLTKCTGSSAYILKRTAAQKYLQSILPMQLPYDHEFDKGWKYGLKVRAITPFPISHENEALSTIGNTKNMKFKWYRRTTTYQYRLKNELSRLIYSILSFLKFRI